MEHTLKNLIRFSGNSSKSEKHRRIQSFHFDYSGHVVSTNSHVLFATKRPYQLARSGKTYSSVEYGKGSFIESNLEFPNWKKVIPPESARRVTLKIPKWFECFQSALEPVILVLDYKDTSSAYLKVSSLTDETSLGLNAKYLSDFSSESVSFIVSSPTSPVIIVDESSDIDPLSKNFAEDLLREEWFYILMPIKLDEEKSKEIYM